MVVITAAVASSRNVLLNKLGNTFVVFGNPQHDCLGFASLHVLSDGQHFLSAEPPKFRIVQVLRGHRR